MFAPSEVPGPNPEEINIDPASSADSDISNLFAKIPEETLTKLRESGLTDEQISEYFKRNSDLLN